MEDDPKPEQHDEADADDHDELLPPFLPEQRVFCLYQQAQPSDDKSKTNNDGNPASKKEQKLYEAIVRQVRRHYNPTNTNAAATPTTKSIPWTFLIHYQGWNARWDRWMDASLLVPDTPHYRQQYEQQQELQRKKDAAAAALQQQKQQQVQLRKQKRKEQQGGATKNQRHNVYPEYCELPFTLKTLLVEEWEHVTRKGFESKYGHDTNNTGLKYQGPARSVHGLPAAITIRQMLKQFEKKRRKQYQKQFDKQQQQQEATTSEKKNDSNDDDDKEEEEQTAPFMTKEQLEEELQAKKQHVRSFCNGLLALFEEALPKCLLYPEERPQLEYLRANNNEKSSSEIYGCEFFLRLLVRLPTILHQADLQKTPSSKSTSNSNNHHELVGPLLADLIVVLQQNRTACFKGNYRPPTYPHEWLDHERQRYRDSHPEEQAGTGQSK